ncbi:hypothetical protein KC872_05155 [Candidatus Kaiserbacteria bacterium]|nr:hypothetical protein [Candidatus Kaiserbacteria bacterium]
MKVLINSVFILFIFNLSQATEILDPKRLELYLPTCKSPQTWSGSHVDPLKSGISLNFEKKPRLQQDQVQINALKERIRSRGLQGLVLGRGPISSKVLIDGQIFSAADEIQFIDTSGVEQAIDPEKTVILLEITSEKGVFYASYNNQASDGVQFDIEWETFFKV